MSKMRVHELAKTLEINSKELIERLRELGVEVKNHMSTIDESVADDVIEILTEGDKKPEEKPSEPEKEKAENEAPVKKKRNKSC